MIWKVLFVIYVFIYLLLSYMGLVEIVNTQSVSVFEALGNYACEIIIVLALIYTFALGWKKRLINERFNKMFYYFSIFAFLLIGIATYKDSYSSMYSDMLVQAMQNGMVPRHFDFQLFLAVTRIEVFIFVGLILFAIFGPFYLGYYHYSKKMMSLNIAEHSGRKCFAVYSSISILLIFVSMLMGVSGDFFKFNIFDCFSILSSVYILVGLIGYAFNFEILTQTFWRVGLPVCVFIELLPKTFFTQDFLNVTGYSAALAGSPVYIIAAYLLTAIAIFMIYRYACTDVVFKKSESVEAQPEENDETI